jgi:hypothetical protein
MTKDWKVHPKLPKRKESELFILHIIGSFEFYGQFFSVPFFAKANASFVQKSMLQFQWKIFYYTE